MSTLALSVWAVDWLARAGLRLAIALRLGSSPEAVARAGAPSVALYWLRVGLDVALWAIFVANLRPLVALARGMLLPATPAPGASRTSPADIVTTRQVLATCLPSGLLVAVSVLLAVVSVRLVADRPHADPWEDVVFVVALSLVPWGLFGLWLSVRRKQAR